MNELPPRPLVDQRDTDEGRRTRTSHQRKLPPADTSAPATLDTASLFVGGRNEVRLLHRGQEYRLRVTRQGKLILTK